MSRSLLPGALWLSLSFGSLVCYGQQAQSRLLNLSFERLDHNAKPISNLPPFLNSTNKNGDKFIISADSTDCVDGKFSMVITADTSAMNLENRGRKFQQAYLAHVGFSLWGDSLRSRHIKITGYLKRYFPGAGTASLFYNEFPQPKDGKIHWMYKGKTNLLGIQSWKEYTLDFKTDSVTKNIIFGAFIALASYGYIKLDDFKVYIDGKQVYNQNQGSISDIPVPGVAR